MTMRKIEGRDYVEIIAVDGVCCVCVCVCVLEYQFAHRMLQVVQ
jgi:hypothetical protein